MLGPPPIFINFGVEKWDQNQLLYDRMLYRIKKISMFNEMAQESALKFALFLEYENTLNDLFCFPFCTTIFSDNEISLNIDIFLIL